MSFICCTKIPLLPGPFPILSPMAPFPSTPPLLNSTWVCTVNHLIKYQMSNSHLSSLSTNLSKSRLFLWYFVLSQLAKNTFNIPFYLSSWKPCKYFDIALMFIIDLNFYSLWWYVNSFFVSSKIILLILHIF